MNKDYHNLELIPADSIKGMQKNIYNTYLSFSSYSNINQRYISIRPILIALLRKISSKFNFRSNTYFLGIYYLDIIFLKNKIPKKFQNNYELLALTCLVLSAKNIENDPSVPSLRMFINVYNLIVKKSRPNFNFQNIYFNDLILAEVMVCKILSYKLNYHTTYDFNSFFFRFGILKFEQLKEINTENNSNFMNPYKIKKILDKIYKKSREYLDIIIKSRICLKYDSLILSIYIMYKSVEYILLKESNLMNNNIVLHSSGEKIIQNKTIKHFKAIMNEIYEINLDNSKEYQSLINDIEVIKLFSTHIISNPDKKNKIYPHQKFQSNYFESLEKNSLAPEEKYTKIKKLKINDKLTNTNNTNKNKIFIRKNSNGSKSLRKRKVYANKTDYDFEYKNIPTANENKTITNLNTNDTSFMKSIHLKDKFKIDNSYNFSTINENKNNQFNLNQFDNFNIEKINHTNSINSKLFKLNSYGNRFGTLKPYSKKVIPKNTNVNLNSKGRIVVENNHKNNNYVHKLNKRIKSIPKNNEYILRKHFHQSIEKKINNSIDVKDKYSPNLILKNSRFKLNLLDKIKESDLLSAQGKKFHKEVASIKSAMKKISSSVNKSKVKGVTSKFQMNKRLIITHNKTPIRTDVNSNLLKKNFGVKRINNIILSNKNNSLDMSLDNKK